MGWTSLGIAGSAGVPSRFGHEEKTFSPGKELLRMLKLVDLLAHYTPYLFLPPVDWADPATCVVTAVRARRK